MIDIPRTEIIIRGNEYQAPLALSLKRGLTEHQMVKLVNYANVDPLVLANTSDSRRFGTLAALDNWTAKRRTIYTLTDADEELLGIVWFGTEPLPRRDFNRVLDSSKFNITTAERIYGYARGKSLSSVFIAASFGMLLSDGVYPTFEKEGVWFETSFDNNAIIRSWGKFGFELISDQNEHKKILMAAKGETILQKLIEFQRPQSIAG